jgi:cell wall-associated NlpC family hydrolase
VKCRDSGRRRPRSNWAHGAIVATVVGLLGAGAAGLGGFAAPLASATTPTTTPGPAPNQSQINAAESQVATIEATLSQEEQQSSLLDNRYDTAVQDQQNAQAALATVTTRLVQTKTAVSADKRRLDNDAVKAYIYGTPQSKFTSLFASSADLSDARDQYTQQIVGNLTQAQKTLQTTESQLSRQQSRQQSLATQAQAQANQAQALAAANQQEAAATQATLSTVKGQLATEVAQAAVEEAQQEAAAAAQASSAAAAQQAAAASQAAASVAGEVGGSASAAAATTAADQAASASSGAVGGSATGSAQGEAAANAAISQLGVPYVFGGEDPGVGFDCSGLVQWAWAQAGVSIPRTTETQWPALDHVSLDALEPGDLLFYYNLDGDNEIDHVVMYIGSGPYGTQTVIQAPYTGAYVSYSPIWTQGLYGAARP